jgi:hypothetical protein
VTSVSERVTAFFTSTVAGQLDLHTGTRSPHAMVIESVAVAGRRHHPGFAI